jgi:ubiquinone/menaquinone biosynthesis C-methylase UbiE
MGKCTCNLYENKDLREALGETLRPGGFSITERAMGFAELKKGSRVLDIGSGLGDTVNFLREEYGLDAIGLEPSELLISEAERKYPGICILRGVGEKIPAGDMSLDGVFAECTLSLMDDLYAVVDECSRVLRKGGYFVISDVYARRPEHIQELHAFSFKSCLRGMLDLDKLIEKLKAAGFEINLLEDQTDCLRQLTVKLIFEYGSMGVFWNKMSGCGSDMDEFRNLMSKCRTGYFLMVCRKV